MGKFPPLHSLARSSGPLLALAALLLVGESAAGRQLCAFPTVAQLDLPNAAASELPEQSAPSHGSGWAQGLEAARAAACGVVHVGARLLAQDAPASASSAAPLGKKRHRVNGLDETDFKVSADGADLGNVSFEFLTTEDTVVSAASLDLLEDAQYDNNAGQEDYGDNSCEVNAYPRAEQCVSCASLYSIIQMVLGCTGVVKTVCHAYLSAANYCEHLCLLCQQGQSCNISMQLQQCLIMVCKALSIGVHPSSICYTMYFNSFPQAPIP